jgi:hypothetical protein
MTEGLCRARAERRGIVSVPASSEPDRAKPDPDKQQCCYDPDCPDVGHRIGERKVRQNRDRRIRSQVLPDRVVLHGTTAPNVTLAGEFALGKERCGSEPPQPGLGRECRNPTSRMRYEQSLYHEFVITCLVRYTNETQAIKAGG